MRKISSQTPLQQRISLGYPPNTSTTKDFTRISTRSPRKDFYKIKNLRGSPQDPYKIPFQEPHTAGLPDCPKLSSAQRAQPSRRPWPENVTMTMATTTTTTPPRRRRMRMRIRRKIRRRMRMRMRMMIMMNITGIGITTIRLKDSLVQQRLQRSIFIHSLPL